MSKVSLFFFFNDTATTEIYTLSLHDALPIFRPGRARAGLWRDGVGTRRTSRQSRDRKSTRLNSSHGSISYAVFCLTKHITTMTEWKHDLPKTHLALLRHAHAP